MNKERQRDDITWQPALFIHICPACLGIDGRAARLTQQKNDRALSEREREERGERAAERESVTVRDCETTQVRSSARAKRKAAKDECVTTSTQIS